MEKKLGKEKKRGGGGEEEMERKGEKKKTKLLSSRVSNSNLLLKSQMPYPSPTVSLKLQCEQF